MRRCYSVCKKWGWAGKLLDGNFGLRKFPDLSGRPGKQQVVRARKLINRRHFQPIFNHFFSNQKIIFLSMRHWAAACLKGSDSYGNLSPRLAIPDGILLCKRELKISRGCTSVFAKHSERRFMRVFSPCKSGQADWQLLGDSTSFAKRSRVGGWVGHSILYTLGCSLYHPKVWSWADRM